MRKTINSMVMMMVVTAFILATSESARASKTDSLIITSANKSYVFTNYLKDDDIKIESKAGVVTLKGTVKNESHKSIAQDTLEGLPGVKRVQNYLKIKGKSAAEKSDEWISARVRSMLLFHRNVNSVKTEVQVKNGIVTLKGEATSTAQKDLTTEYAKDVLGVKNVDNQMTVSRANKTPDQKTMGENLDDMTESIDDASITALVKMTLLYHRSTSARNTTVTTNQGVVQLDGKARNSAEKDLTTKLVREVRGVKSVINKMVHL